ncbi:MAG: ligand-binding sensor domain-containing protein [Polaribacter sp.]|jgi:ligand-binding sensor domain-containing protein
MNFSKLTLFLTFTFLLQGSIQAQDWDSFQSQGQINDLVDNGTELLMATDAGLVVMDKTTFEKTVFNMSNSNLSNTHIQTITETTDGTIWIGTFNTVIARFEGTDFQDITIPQSDELDQNTELFYLKVAPNSDFWLGTSDGVYHKQDQNWFHYDGDEMGPNFFEAWDIEINSSGDVFIASRDVSKFSNGVWTNTTTGTGLSGYLDADLFFNNAGD